MENRSAILPMFYDISGYINREKKWEEEWTKCENSKRVEEEEKKRRKDTRGGGMARWPIRIRMM